MPENELAIPFTEVKRLIATTANRSRVKQLQTDIDNDKIGIVYAYRKGNIAFEIKRYRTCRIIKRVY